MPPLLYDIMRVLLLLTGPAAFICLLRAGIALRQEGGTVFWVGGGFSKWMLWAVIFLGLEPTLTWFQFFGVPVFFPPGFGIGTPWLASIQQDVSTFVSSFVVGRIAPGVSPERAQDEISVLAESFNRMRRSLERALKIIDNN